MKFRRAVMRIEGKMSQGGEWEERAGGFKVGGRGTCYSTGICQSHIKVISSTLYLSLSLCSAPSLYPRYLSCSLCRLLAVRALIIDCRPRGLCAMFGYGWREHTFNLMAEQFGPCVTWTIKRLYFRHLFWSCNNMWSNVKTIAIYFDNQLIVKIFFNAVYPLSKTEMSCFSLFSIMLKWPHYPHFRSHDCTV